MLCLAPVKGHYRAGVSSKSAKQARVQIRVGPRLASYRRSPLAQLVAARHVHWPPRHPAVICHLPRHRRLSRSQAAPESGACAQQ